MKYLPDSGSVNRKIYLSIVKVHRLTFGRRPLVGEVAALDQLSVRGMDNDEVNTLQPTCFKRL